MAQPLILTGSPALQVPRRLSGGGVVWAKALALMAATISGSASNEAG